MECDFLLWIILELTETSLDVIVNNSFLFLCEIESLREDIYSRAAAVKYPKSQFLKMFQKGEKKYRALIFRK